MAGLLKSLKSLKSLKGLQVPQGEESDVMETPTDPHVKQAQAHLPEVSPSSSYQGDNAASNVIQTPTCPEAAEAEAELTVTKSRPSLSAIRQSFSRRGHKPRQSVEFAAADLVPRQKSFAGVKGLASRSSGRYLASSKSSPNLLVPSADTVCVLGKECRSRRRIATADNDASGPPASLAELKDMGSGNFSKKPLERRSSSTAALYQLLGPMPSPFLDAELAECSLGGGTNKDQGSLPGEALHYTPAQLGSPTGPGLERRRLSRKLTGGKVVVSTEPLEEHKGDIMLPPQVVDFAADALASIGGSYTGEIEFSGGSARAIRRLSRHTSQEELNPLKPSIAPKAGIAAA